MYQTFDGYLTRIKYKTNDIMRMELQHFGEREAKPNNKFIYNLPNPLTSTKNRIIQRNIIIHHWGANASRAA